MKNSIAPKLGTPHAELHTALHTESPIGRILCAESSREQVELLQMHKDGIPVAEYWTELPPKAELEQKLHVALLEARERQARREVLLGGGGVMRDDLKVSKSLGGPRGGVGWRNANAH